MHLRRPARTSSRRQGGVGSIFYSQPRPGPYPQPCTFSREIEHGGGRRNNASSQSSVYNWGMTKKRAKRRPLSDVLRDAIRASIEADEFTRRGLCHAAGIEESSLCRFLAGRSLLSASSIDNVCEVLDLSLVEKSSPAAKRQRRVRKKKSPTLMRATASDLRPWP